MDHLSKGAKRPRRELKKTRDAHTRDSRQSPFFFLAFSAFFLASGPVFRKTKIGPPGASVSQEEKRASGSSIFRPLFAERERERERHSKKRAPNQVVGKGKEEREEMQGRLAGGSQAATLYLPQHRAVAPVPLNPFVMTAGSGQQRNVYNPRVIEIASTPEAIDALVGRVCSALALGRPVDRDAVRLLIDTARARGAQGTDDVVLGAICQGGMADAARVSAGRGSSAGMPLEARGLKRRARRALYRPGEVAPRDVALTVCRKVNRGEQVTQAEVEALREIARAEGSVGANFIPDAGALCRAALTLLGEPQRPAAPQFTPSYVHPSPNAPPVNVSPIDYDDF